MREERSVWMHYICYSICAGFSYSKSEEACDFKLFLFKNSKSGSAKFFLEQTPFFLKPPVSSRGHSRVVMVVVVVRVAVIMVVNATRGQLIARYFERFLRVLDGRRREILTKSTRARGTHRVESEAALGLASYCSLQFLRWLLRRRTSRGTSRVLR